MKTIKLNSFIISIVIFLNIYQIGLSWLIGLKFNMIILEYGLFILLLIVNKFTFSKKQNLLRFSFYIYFMIISFALTYLFNNNGWLDYYFTQFVSYGLILLLIFLLRFDFKYLYKYLIIHSYMTVLIYLLVLFSGKVVLSDDYMTWGLNITFGFSFILADTIINKKLLKFVYLVPIAILIVINGNKGTVLILGIVVLFSLYRIWDNWLKKTIATIVMGVFFLNLTDIFIYLINNLESTGLITNSYALNGFKTALNQGDYSLLFDSRVNIYDNSVMIIQENIIGLGIGKFEEIFGLFPHNLFLDIFVTYGVIIGIPFLCLIIYEIISGYKSIKNKQQLVIFIAIFSNFMRLMVSKTFVSDPMFWLMISFAVLIKVGKR